MLKISGSRAIIPSSTQKVTTLPAEITESPLENVSIKQVDSATLTTSSNSATQLHIFDPDPIEVSGYFFPAQSKRDLGHTFFLAPTKTGNGDGKTFYIISGFDTGSVKENKMFRDEAYELLDDIQKLRDNGYSVIIVSKGTSENFKQALYDQRTAGIYFTGHGSPNAIKANDGPIYPSSLDSKKASKNLRFCVLASCSTGQSEQKWEAAMKTDVIAWDQKISQSTSEDFANQDSSLYNFIFGDREELDDLVEDRLINTPWTD